MNDRTDGRTDDLNVQSAPLIVCEDLSLRYPGRAELAVTGVSFELDHGATLAVIGEAGSGKTTLMRALAGTARQRRSDSPQPAGGELTVLGRRLSSLRRRSRARWQFDVGSVDQDAGNRLHPQLTIAETIAEPIYLRDPRFDRRAASIAVATLLDLVHLPLGDMGRYPYELSRGQRQRVALARALILEPKLLVADDLTTGVDVTVRGAMLDVLREVQRERGFGMVVVGHEIRHLRRLTDRIAVLHGGFVVGAGSIDHVLENPQHPYVRRLAETARP